MANISFYMDIQVFLLTHLLTQILCSGLHNSVKPPSKAIPSPHFQRQPYTKKHLHFVASASFSVRLFVAGRRMFQSPLRDSF